MNSPIKRNWMMPLTIIVMLVVSAVLYPTLPENVPTRWSFSGEAVATQPRLIAVLLLPALAVFIWGLTAILPYIDPRRESYATFEPSYSRMRIATVVFLGGLHILMLTQYDNPDVMLKIVFFAIALLMAVIGNEMGRFRQTWFTGIRTPWTLSDERVWKRVHRVGARYVVGVSIIHMVIVIVAPMPFAGIATTISLVGVMLGITLYSYIVYRRLNG